jgi:drug/metabolite transporter, DME family
MGFLYLITAATLWGMIGPISKFLFAQGMPPLETAFWRSAIAGAAFFAHWLVKRDKIPTSLRDLFGILLLGIFGVASLEGSYVNAVHFGGAALASVLLYSAPIWVNLSGLLFFKEKIPARRWAALTLTMTGILGLCLWGATATYSFDAIFWGLLSGFSYALFYVAGKLFFHRIQPVVVYMIAFPIGSLTLLLFTQPFRQHIPTELLSGSLSEFLGRSHLTVFGFNIDTTSLLGCLFLGLVSTYLPYLLYAAGLRLVHTSRASIITMIEPLVSISLAAIIWGERFTVAGYFFASIVILGVAIS